MRLRCRDDRDGDRARRHGRRWSLAVSRRVHLEDLSFLFVCGVSVESIDHFFSFFSFLLLLPSLFPRAREWRAPWLEEEEAAAAATILLFLPPLPHLQQPTEEEATRAAMAEEKLHRRRSPSSSAPVTPVQSLCRLPRVPLPRNPPLPPWSHRERCVLPSKSGWNQEIPRFGRTRGRFARRFGILFEFASLR